MIARHAHYSVGLCLALLHLKFYTLEIGIICLLERDQKLSCAHEHQTLPSHDRR